MNHEILLKKLRKINVDQHSVNWFANYLSNRYQKVEALGHKSDKSLVKYGVPQGSILGTLLFIIYINDLTEYVVDINVKLYADNTAVYTSAHSQVESMLNMRLDIDVVAEWLKANKLTLNTNKTKYVVFGTNTKTTSYTSFDLKINGTSIE